MIYELMCHALGHLQVQQFGKQKHAISRTKVCMLTRRWPPRVHTARCTCICGRRLPRAHEHHRPSVHVYGPTVVQMCMDTGQHACLVGGLACTPARWIQRIDWTQECMFAMEANPEKFYTPRLGA